MDITKYLDGSYMEINGNISTDVADQINVPWEQASSSGSRRILRISIDIQSPTKDTINAWWDLIKGRYSMCPYSRFTGISKEELGE
jgi:hypothetical protein